MFNLEYITITADYFVYSFLIAVFSFVYSNILTDNGELLNGLKKLLYKLNNEERLNAGHGYHWLYKVLIFCEKCISGQIALWSFLIIHFQEYRNGAFVLVFPHFLFITLTIFFAVIIKKFYTKFIQ